MIEPRSIDLDAVGQVVEGRPYRVTIEEIAAFAAATNDRVPDCLAGRVAPPIYAVNPVLTTIVAAKKRVSVAFGFHGEHDFRFLRPILPAMDIVPRAEVIGIHQRSTGVTITVHVVSRAAGEVLKRQYFCPSFPRRKSNRASELKLRAAASLHPGATPMPRWSASCNQIRRAATPQPRTITMLTRPIWLSPITWDFPG
jgi:acyl dehydratase